MTETKVNKLITKIFWFSLPFIIGFFTWITVTIYSVDSGLKIINSSEKKNEQMNEKMWTLIQDNNKILLQKADQETNEKEHQILLTKINDVQIRVDQIYRNRKMFGSTVNKINNDTIYIIPYKESNDLVWNVGNIDKK